MCLTLQLRHPHPISSITLCFSFCDNCHHHMTSVVIWIQKYRHKHHCTHSGNTQVMVCLAACCGVHVNKPCQWCLFHLLLSALNNISTHISFQCTRHSGQRWSCYIFWEVHDTNKKQWMAQHHYCMLCANSLKMYAGPVTSANHGQETLHIWHLNVFQTVQYLTTI